MAKEYDQLLDSYKSMFGMVDAFHFNSQNTAYVYGKYLSIPVVSKVIHITHSGIQDHRKLRNYNEHKLRLGFIGSEAPFKGLPMLKDVIGMLNQEGFSDRIELHVYGGRTGQDELLPNVIFKGRFTSAMMEQVFDDMDLLVVPSIWYETFSLVALEALSFGTCVIVSDRVGAKDIVSQYDSRFVVSSREELHDMLASLLDDRSFFSKFNMRLVNSEWPYSIENHCKDIISFYKTI